MSDDKSFARHWLTATNPESVTPWLDKKGDMRLHAYYRARPGCLVFEVHVKQASAQPTTRGSIAFYWTRVMCQVVSDKMTLQMRRDMLVSLMDLVSIRMGKPYQVRGRTLK